MNSTWEKLCFYYVPRHEDVYGQGNKPPHTPDLGMRWKYVISFTLQPWEAAIRGIQPSAVFWYFEKTNKIRKKRIYIKLGRQKFFFNFFNVISSTIQYWDHQLQRNE